MTEIQAEWMTSSAVEHYWPQMQAELERVPHIWDTWWTLDALHDSLLSGHTLAVGVGPKESIRLVVFVQVGFYPANNILTVFLAFGNGLDECLPLFEATIDQLAQKLNCGIVEVRGRKGWERKLHGFKNSGVVLTRRVDRQRVH